MIRFKKSFPQAVKGNKHIKVPVIMQMEAMECGAASLAMILAYYKKWIPLEQVRADCGVSRDGSRASNIIRAARQYNLNAQGYKYNAETLKKQGAYPCIIHWNFNHFVVLCGFKGKKAIINDPAKGTVEIPEEEFNTSYTGICLEFTPGDGFEQSGKPRSVIKFVGEQLDGALIPLLFVMSASLLTAFTGILIPAFSRIFADNILTHNNPDWFYPFIFALIGLIIYQLSVNIIKGIYLLKIKGKLAIMANVKFMWHTLRLPVEFFSQRMAGDLVGRQTSNDDIAETLITKLAPTLINLALLIFYFIVMIKYSVMLTIVGVATVVINLLLARYISKKRVNITRTQMRDQGKLNAVTVGAVDMIETIKASGAENVFFEKWTGYHASVNKSTVQFAKTSQFLGAIPSLVHQISGVIILSLGALLIMRGQFTAGMLLAFQSFMTSFLTPVNELITAGQSVQEMRASMERIDDVMKSTPDTDDYKNQELIKLENESGEEENLDKLSGVIEIKNVTFGYSRLSEPLVTDFSMTLSPGSKVAFVGSSGCGKSTLAKLISGLYKPWSGEILFDGKNPDEIPRSVFTGSVAVVDQDIIMFEDSIADNIKMWDSTIEDFEMIMAARDAQIHEDIMLRENGYGCKVAEGGRNFSGGQRQRFEIARVLAQDPTIIILDEATSALDAKTEYEVTRAIKERGVTCIIIAHRLSTIRDCDEIIVMNRGKVVERGTHDELYKSGGMYAKLITIE